MRRAPRGAGAWHLVMHADPDPADLLAVRECAAKVVELVRSEAYLEKNGSFDGDSRDAEDRAEEKDGLSSSAKDGFVFFALLLWRVGDGPDPAFRPRLGLSALAAEERRRRGDTKRRGAAASGGRGGRRARARECGASGRRFPTRAAWRGSTIPSRRRRRCTLEGARRRHGHDAFLVGPARYFRNRRCFRRRRRAGAERAPSAARGSDENAKTRKRRFRIVREPRFWKSAPRGVVRGRRRRRRGARGHCGNDARHGRAQAVRREARARGDGGESFSGASRPSGTSCGASGGSRRTRSGTR